MNKLINVQELDRQIAEIEEKLLQYQSLLQRRADLLNLKAVAKKLNGDIADYPKPPVSGELRGTGGILMSILKERGPQTLSDLLTLSRSYYGYQGSGQDGIDKKRLAAAMYQRADIFERKGEKWGLKS